MKCDRRDSLVTSSETLADALEHHRIEQLRPSAIGTHRQGVGCLFVAQPHLPRPPTLRRFVISCAGHTRLTSYLKNLSLNLDSPLYVCGSGEV
jgi:hypothetical protein